MELRDLLVTYGYDSAIFNDFFNNADSRKYSQIAGLFTKNGQNDFISISPVNGVAHTGLKGSLGPVDLAGEKSGFDFMVDIHMDWQFLSSGADITTSTLAAFLNNVEDRV